MLTNKLNAALMLGTALTGLMISSDAALAQNEQVTVTGTSIRGQAPVGANVISVNRTAIEESGAQTTQQLLSTVPQLNDFGSSAQGDLNTGVRQNGGPDGAGQQTPTIHSLGSSSSSSTLILINGHRLPLTGLNKNLVDPSIIPANALQKVEILPDGASAIYGSDAVAGVINFHTRKDYSGWETTVQYGIADNYSSFGAGQVLGHSWDTGSMVAAYNYSSRSRLMNQDRDFATARQDLRRGAADPSLFIVNPATGATLTGNPLTDGPYPNLLPGQPYPSEGGNFRNFTSCPTAVIASSSNSNVPGYVYPYAAGNIVQRQATAAGTAAGGPGVGICDVVKLQTNLPSETRNSGLVNIRQGLTERLQVSVDLIYSARLSGAINNRGGVTNAVAFNPAGTGDAAFNAANGGSALEALRHTNPFYVNIPGAAATANSQFISMDFTELLAGQGNRGGATQKTGQITAMATLGIDYDLGGDWLGSFGGTVGTDNSFQRNAGALNTNMAFLAINGTVLASGAAARTAASSNTPDPYGLGTIVSITRALTTANALDVWRPAATNRTNPAVLRSLVDSATIQDSVQQMQNATMKFDGPLFDVFGAGALKMAFGGEYIHYTQNARLTRNGQNANSVGARYTLLNFERTVYAAFTELVIPVIDADMNIPLIQNLTFDLAGRYDHYSDFGDTANPKVSFNWDIIDGLRTSASLGNAFTAPSLTSVGAGKSGLNANAGVNGGGASNNLIIPFNDTRPFNNGAGIAGTFVSNAVACNAAGSTPVTASGANAPAGGGLFDVPGSAATGCKINSTNSPGLTTGGANANLQPQIGLTYSANLVVDFGRLFGEFFDGLNLQVTYYEAKINGLITNGSVQTTATVPGLPQLTTFGPAVGTGGLPGWDPSDLAIQNLLAVRPLTAALPVRIYSLQSVQVQNALNLWQNGIDFSASYRISTDDYGDFTLGVSGNEIFRFSQQNAGGTPPFDIKNGKNTGRFVGQELTGSISLNWRMAPYSFGVRFNHQSPYNDDMSTFPFNLPGPNRVANTKHVGALQTVNLSASADLPEDWISGSQVNINVNDLFNVYGPAANDATGLGAGSAIGRQITVSLRKKW